MKVREILDYNPETGEFRWLKQCRKICGTSRHHSGYKYIRVYGKLYAAHRLAWLWITNEWPNGEIDHLNRKRDDNRWANLRVVSDQVNSRNRTLGKNNTSGTIGVHFSENGRGWWIVKAAGEYIGSYRSKEEAIQIAQQARETWRPLG